VRVSISIELAANHARLERAKRALIRHAPGRPEIQSRPAATFVAHLAADYLATRQIRANLPAFESAVSAYDIAVSPPSVKSGRILCRAV
jgi:hypothetical protein